MARYPLVCGEQWGADLRMAFRPGPEHDAPWARGVQERRRPVRDGRSVEHAGRHGNDERPLVGLHPKQTPSAHKGTEPFQKVLVESHYLVVIRPLPLERPKYD